MVLLQKALGSSQLAHQVRPILGPASVASGEAVGPTTGPMAFSIPGRMVLLAMAAMALS